MVQRFKAELLEPVKSLTLGKVKVKTLEDLHSTLKTIPASHIKKKEIINWLDGNFPGLMLLQTELITYKGDFRKKSVNEIGKLINYLKDEVSFEEYIKDKCVKHLKDNIEVKF